MNQKKFRILAALCCSMFLTMACDEDSQENTNQSSTQPAEKSYCGDNVCNDKENSDNCPQDCPVICGDNLCNGNENNALCPDDCPIICGDYRCEGNETNRLCPLDCQAVCGNNVCDIGETYVLCPKDCKIVCGDGSCDGNEDHNSCPADCPAICGDNACNGTEDHDSCPTDCRKITRCGDNACEAGETRQSCPIDCPTVCGDGHCEVAAGESTENCTADCGEPQIIDTHEPVCGDSICEDPETELSCPEDCQVAPTILTMDEFNALAEGNYYFFHDYAAAMNPSTESVAAGLDDFFAFPYPSELRTDNYGRPIIKGWPLPAKITSVPLIGGVLQRLLDAVENERAGFSPLGAIYIRSSAGLGGNTFPTPAETMAEDACIQLINVEPESRHYGERVPVYVTFHGIGDENDRKLWAQNTLVLRPVPGVAQNPGDRHVAIVKNCLRSNGRSFSQSSRLKAILNKTAPKAITDKTDFYVDQLTKLGVDLTQIRAMTGYDTQNVALEMDQMAEELKGKGHIFADDNGVAIGVWTDAAGANAMVFHGRFITYNFIEGDYSGNYPSYSGKGQGVINFDTSGKLVSKGHEETVEFAVSVPIAPMPEKGFPIAVYGHGTGGDAVTHCVYSKDEGFILTINGVNIAMIGFDACLQGNRTGGKSSEGALYLSLLQNTVVVRESIRQTVNDMLVLYDIIDNGKLVLPPHVYSGGKNITFDPSYGLFMGHSQGSQEAGLLLGLTDSIKNAFLSAGGGGVALSMVELVPEMDLQEPFKTMLKDKTIADMFGILLGVGEKKIGYDAFITTQIAQPLMDPIDPLNFSQRFIREPAPGIRPKNIAQTMGLNDRCTPMITQMTLAASIGLPIVGTKFAETDATALMGLSEPVSSPVSNNITNVNGDVVTGGFMEFHYLSSWRNPHFILYHMKPAYDAYLDFFRSVLAGTPTVSVNGNQEGDDTI